MCQYRHALKIPEWLNYCHPFGEYPSKILWKVFYVFTACYTKNTSFQLPFLG
jgi:hypothetical protein